MASITIEGLLEIDLVDFWSWASREGHTTDAPVTKVFWSADDDALVLESSPSSAAPHEPTYVDAADFWRWVIDEQIPKGISSFEIVFGVPMVSLAGSSCVEISFAASNESDPRNWARPPACLAEWDAARARGTRAVDSPQ